jgi:hypothetical protein
MFALVSILTCGYLAFRRLRHKGADAPSHKNYGTPEVKHDVEEVKDSVPPVVVGEPQLRPPKKPSNPSGPQVGRGESDCDLLGLQDAEESGISNGGDVISMPPGDTDAEVELDHLINSIVNSKEHG